MKKLIILVFASLLTVFCSAQQIQLENPDTFYEIVDDTLLVISGQGNLENWRESKNLWDEYKNNIKAIVIEDGIRDIAKNYFYGLPELKSVTMANSVKRILQAAFYGCPNLETVVFPDSLEVIKAEAFSICPKITSLWLPNTVTEIGDAAFAACKLTTLRLPDFITEISDDAFWSGNLTSIEIPPLVTVIGEKAFYNNRLLKKVKLSASLILIDDDAFGFALDIDTVIALNPVPPTTYLDFFVREERIGIPKVIVPVTSVTAYENASYWDVFTVVGGGYVAFSHTVTDDNKVGGHVIQPEQRFYQPGEQATFTAIPAEGYRFVNWTTYASSTSKAQVEVSTDSVYICTIGEDNVELTANFEKITSGIAPAATSHSEPVVYTQRRTIVVENTTAAVQLFDLTGRLVAQGIGAGSYSVPQAGVYIVKAGSGVKKVVVK